MKRLLLAAMLALLFHCLLFSTKVEWGEKIAMKGSRPEPIILALYYSEPKRTPPPSPKRIIHQHVQPALPKKVLNEKTESLVEPRKPEKILEKTEPIFKPQETLSEPLKENPINELESPFIEEIQPDEQIVGEIPPIPTMQSMDAYVLKDIADEPPVLATPPLRIAVPVHKNKPTYPRMARRRGYEGTVILKVLVGADGKVEDLQVLESSGYGILDKAAEDSVKGWLFEPWKRGDESIEMWGKVIVSFKLK